MKNNEEFKPMPKWLIYTLFVLKFALGIALIYWTIYTTLQSDVGKDDDNAFLSDYQKVDRNFNDMVAQNNIFEENYNVKFLFNEEEIIGLSYEDIFLSQRVIKNRDTRKSILKIGKNRFTVLVQDKNGNDVKNKEIDILVTKTTTHEHDVKLSFKDDSKEFDINSLGYWNITGTITVGNNKGNFYIKTNAKK
ncbi:MAG: hypothetical protein U9Q20_03885 [Campylobacterota bacterium]|nr:hypothetical protein [Campylobacterota bacterium]